MLEITALLGQIVRLCAEQKSGTLFLTTTDNKACQIVFEQGRIIAMAYGTIRGAAVADILPRLVVQASQFNSTLTMPLSSKAKLDDDNSVFVKLGLRRSTVQQIAPTHSQRMYRGHAVVSATESLLTAKSDVKPAKPRKARRIYRGQVLED